MSTSSGFDSDSSLSPPPALLSSPVPASKPKSQSRPRKNRQATLDFRPQPVAPRVPFTDRPRDEDIFAAAVAASKADPVASDAQTKSQDGQPSKFSSVLDEIMSDDDDDAGSTSFNSSTISSSNPKGRSRGGRKPAARKQTTSSPAPAVVKKQRRPRKPSTAKLANPMFKRVPTPSSAGGSAAPSPLASSIASPAPSASGDAAAGSSSGELSSPPSDFEPEFLLNDSDLDDEGDDDEEDDKAVPDAVKSESQADDQKPNEGKEKSGETKKPERKRLIPNPREPMYAPEISFLVMFRARFAEVYAGFPDLGPQDFEEGLVSSPASPAVLGFLCRTLSLVLNRKKNVEPAHFARPMDEAVSTYGPAYWGPLNPTGPFVGGLTFHTMTWEARLEVLVALVHWSLTASEAVRQVLVQGYSQQRTDDDSASPLAVLPIGLDSERKRYYLIEGENDTRFRLFCETNPRKRLVNWTPVASNFAEFKEFVDKLLETDTSRNGKALVESLTEELPRLEASELRRRKRDQRMLKRQYDEMQAADTGLYSGRTRGKKVNYTNDGGVVGEEEEEDEYGDEEEEEVERKTSATRVYTTASGRASRKPPVPAAFIDPDEPDISDEDTAASSSKREVRKAASAGRQQYVYPNGAEDDDEDEDELVGAEKPSLTVVLKYRKTNRDIPMTDVASAPQAVALESR